MRVYYAAICTLAVLAGLDLTRAAVTTANPQALAGGRSGDVQYYQDYQKAVVVPTADAATDSNRAQIPTKSQPAKLSAPVTLGSTTTAATGRSQVPIKPVDGSLNNRPLTPIPDRSDELVVIATNVQVVGASEELQQRVRKVIQTRAGGETSQSKLQRDMVAILDTGLFTNAYVNSRSTPAGLNVVYQVEPVVVRSLQLSGASVLTQDVALERFKPQLGDTISPTALNQCVQKIDEWYAQNGYTLARVLSVRTSSEGAIVLEVAEGVVDKVKFRFFSEDGKLIDEQGKPVQGRTQQNFLRRELKLKPGQVFREELVQQDLQQLYQLGLFQTVNVALEGNARLVDVIYNLKELTAKAVNFGGGYSDDIGIFGTVSYKDQNVSGISDRFGVDALAGLRDLQFAANFTSVYRASNPDRLGYQVNAFRRGGLSQTFDDDIKLPNDDRPRESQFGGSIILQRPIDNWQASLGLNYTRTSIRDRDGEISPVDELGKPLSFSGTGIDDLFTVSLSAMKDQRDNPIYPTQGSVLSLSAEQSIPIGRGNISMNRLRAHYSQYFPVQLLHTKDPEVLAFNIQGGTTIGDLPPYEAFNLGGVNTVRGYDLGDVGSGRSYVLASAEYRFPIFKIVSGVFFADFASDLGSGDTVLGEPAPVRGKPGSGFGYGAGVRFDSAIGIIRADLGINDRGESRLQFGIGQQF